MDWIDVNKAADNWQISVRQVQRLVASGRVPGASKLGRTWLIPADTKKPKDLRVEKTVAGVVKEDAMKTAFPLLSGTYARGKAADYIAEIEDSEMRLLASAEYRYFRGDCESAFRLTNGMMLSKSRETSISACVLHAMSSFSCKDVDHIIECFSQTDRVLKNLKSDSAKDKAIYALFSNMQYVVLHDTSYKLNKTFKYMEYMPEGLRFYWCYVYAHYQYLCSEYERSLGAALCALNLSTGMHPIPEIYLALVCAMSSVGIHEGNSAKYYYTRALSIAEADGFYLPFAKLNALIPGLAEICLKKTDPKLYKRISDMEESFLKGWVAYHNIESEHEVTKILTTEEFSIAMLFSRGWAYKEIASQMEISENAVKYHIMKIYKKLNISRRSELKAHMLK